jgi:hypothetical protein
MRAVAASQKMATREQKNFCFLHLANTDKSCVTCISHTVSRGTTQPVSVHTWYKSLQRTECRCKDKRILVGLLSLWHCGLFGLLSNSAHKSQGAELVVSYIRDKLSSPGFLVSPYL